LDSTTSFVVGQKNKMARTCQCQFLSELATTASMISQWNGLKYSLSMKFSGV